MKTKLFVLMLVIMFGNVYANASQCSTEAISQAEKLLAFSSDNDDRASVESKTKQLASVTNPVDNTQKFITLEVMGYIYKATYRMRFLYYPIGDSCVLMGQEILELSQL